jgi:hypothetical protein
MLVQPKEVVKARMGCRNNELLHLDNATAATGDHSNRPPLRAAAAGEVSSIFMYYSLLFLSLLNI